MQKADLAFVFPGQGSQAVGMLKDLAGEHPEVQETFQEASEILQVDLWRLTQEGPKESLNQTVNTQPAMLAAGVAVWRVWNKQTQVSAAYMAGHSLGEYTALVCAQALSFEAATRLVAERGRLMQASVPAGEGAMAVVLGLEDDQVRAVCEQAQAGQICAAVNFNAPGQVVMAGNTAAIDRACALAKEAGARRAQKLAVSVPSHCALMRDAAVQLLAQLRETDLQLPVIPVIQNADVQSFQSVDDIRNALAEQLYMPVRWVETIQRLAELGVTQTVECGPGKVLMGLTKRIDKNIANLGVFDVKSLTTTLEKVT